MDDLSLRAYALVTTLLLLQSGMQSVNIILLLFCFAIGCTLTIYLYLLLVWIRSNVCMCVHSCVIYFVHSGRCVHCRAVFPECVASAPVCSPGLD